MGVPGSSVLDLIQKLGSWISWGVGDIASLPGEFDLMPCDGWKMCYNCDAKLDGLGRSYYCQGCGRNFCVTCVRGYECSVVGRESHGNADAGESINACKFCSDDLTRKYSKKVHPLPCPQDSLDSDSFSSNGKRMDFVSCESCTSRNYDYSSDTVPHSSITSFNSQLSPASCRYSHFRCDERDGGDSGRHYFSASSEFCHDSSDIDSSSVSTRYELYNCQSEDPSPLASPSRFDFNPSRIRPSVQQMQETKSPSRIVIPHNQENKAVLGKPLMGANNVEKSVSCSDDSVFKKSLDLENNHLIWFPPPPKMEDDEMESNFFTYDDDDDDIGDSGAMFSSCTSLSGMLSVREKQNGGSNDTLLADIQGHFRALVSQLIESEDVKVGGGNSVEDWIDVVTDLAWQGAKFVKPDTRRGGSMDPCDYVKVKCIASGSPRDSILVKGVVCTKNIKHKRMTSQYKNARVLILGGALEYQRVASQLASFNTLLQQENDHFKMIISRIEALRPNVLLVEKSVSSFAQEHLLGKDISLVLNVKRPLLERIARCTGAYITPSVDSIPTTRLGTCELFRLERVSEEHETINQSNKKPAKTLMFFEGCPRRLGVTVLLRGACREELKKLKRIVLYAIFAAHHLSLETSFLADEGATLPNIAVEHGLSANENTVADNTTLATSSSLAPSSYHNINDMLDQDEYSSPRPEFGGLDLMPGLLDRVPFPSGSVDYVDEDEVFDAHRDNSSSNTGSDICSQVNCQNPSALDEKKLDEGQRFSETEMICAGEVSSEYISATDTHRGILVSFSSYCVPKGTVCERSKWLRIKFYGYFDKPLGRYLLDDLFDPASYCRSCQEPAEAHVLCYTHQQGNITINIKRLDVPKLPGEKDGKIWMWHRCLRCTHVDGVPPASHRVVMSDAAWGLSFGKFLELSFTNHATANRVATCGHSLQRDCIHFYGFGNKVAFFRYSPINILSVHLPPSVLESSGPSRQEWLWKEAIKLEVQMETLYAEISNVLDSMEQKCKSSESKSSDISMVENYIIESKDRLENEKDYYKVLLQPACMENEHTGQATLDILELNRLRRILIIVSHVWDRQLYSLDSLLKRNPIISATLRNPIIGQLKEFNSVEEDDAMKLSLTREYLGSRVQSDKNEQLKAVPSVLCFPEGSSETSCNHIKEEELQLDGEIAFHRSPLDNIFMHASNISHKIDSAWTGAEHRFSEPQPLHMSQSDSHQPDAVSLRILNENLCTRSLMTPSRVCSFDSALRVQERIQKGLPPFSLHLSTFNSFHASRDYWHMVRDPISTVTRKYTQEMPRKVVKSNLIADSPPSFIPSASHLAEGVRLLLPNADRHDIVVAVFDSEPTSIISYALISKEYDDWVSGKSFTQGGWNIDARNARGSLEVDIPTLHSFRPPEMDYIHFGSCASIDVTSSISSLFTDPKKSPHMKISFEDESTVGGKVKFSVTCYFAKEFHSLRNRCCPNKVDFVCSLSRCRKWCAQGGKSRVYFAKSLDERFIIKQVTKTELESFEEFAPKYFKYLTESMDSGSPTCLAKILGVYQVIVKNLEGGKETKMDLMVMENLFFGRNISRVYDLKGSVRSRYNSNTAGENKVLLDMNLLETLLTRPIFLGSKAKRSLERAVWNDTSFLGSADVMDYSLLAGIDEDRKELVFGIIDYMRQYTWDKHLETWVKACGILGGPKNESPTIISPIQYKKRFRKAMTTYFFTVPDHWWS